MGMPSAKAEEVTIVQIESEGYKKEKVIVPICAMKGGSNYQQYIDLLVPSKAKFSLLQGAGPINLLGSHCVDFFGYKDMDADSEEEDEVAEETWTWMKAKEIRKRQPRRIVKVRSAKHLLKLPTVLKRRKRQALLNNFTIRRLKSFSKFTVS